MNDPERLQPELLIDLRTHTGAVLGVTPISGGITNRNYRLDAERGAFMLRVAGERTELLGIDRAHEFAAATSAHGVGVGAKPIVFLAQHGAILTQFIENATTLTAPSAAARLERIVEALKRAHNAPALTSSFSPFQTVRNYHALALEHGVQFPDDLSWLLARAAEIEAALRPHAVICPCHNDLLPANVLDDGRSIWIVDWEYAGNGNRFFDLGNLAVNLELNGAQCDELIRLYFGHSSPSLTAQLHLMRLASDLREAFWGYLQSGISSLEFDFADYGAQHLNRFRQNVATGRYAGWLAALR